MTPYEFDRSVLFAESYNCYMSDVINCNFLYNFNCDTVAPHITPFEFEGPANAGDTVQIACHVPKGDRPLFISWHFHGESLSTHMGISTMMVGHRANFLSISSVTGGHRGVYTCLARNEAGVANYSAELHVNGTLLYVAPLTYFILNIEVGHKNGIRFTTF